MVVHRPGRHRAGWTDARRRPGINPR